MAQRIVPMIAYADGLAAIDFLKGAFGFQEDESQRYVNDDGSLGHAELELGGDPGDAGNPQPPLRRPQASR